MINNPFWKSCSAVTATFQPNRQFICSFSIQLRVDLALIKWSNLKMSVQSCFWADRLRSKVSTSDNALQFPTLPIWWGMAGGWAGWTCRKSSGWSLSRSRLWRTAARCPRSAPAQKRTQRIMGGEQISRRACTMLWWIVCCRLILVCHHRTMLGCLFQMRRDQITLQAASHYPQILG